MIRANRCEPSRPPESTAIRACNHGGHTSVRNQIGIYLLDDFDFNRGMISELVAWAAATRPAPSRVPNMSTGPFRKLELSNAGSSMVRLALDIRPGSRWLESKIDRLQPSGFQVRIWNRLPKARPTVTVRSESIGLPPGDELLSAIIDGPAFRKPIEIEVKPSEDKISLRLSKATTLRLFPPKLQPKLPEGTKFALVRRRPGGGTHELEKDVEWTSTYVQWKGEPGELRAATPQMSRAVILPRRAGQGNSHRKDRNFAPFTTKCKKMSHKLQYGVAVCVYSCKYVRFVRPSPRCPAGDAMDA